MELDSRQTAILEARTKLERDFGRLAEALDVEDYDYAMEITREALSLLDFLDRQSKEGTWSQQ